MAESTATDRETDRPWHREDSRELVCCCWHRMPTPAHHVHPQLSVSASLPAHSAVNLHHLCTRLLKSSTSQNTNACHALDALMTICCINPHLTLYCSQLGRVAHIRQLGPIAIDGVLQSRCVSASLPVSSTTVREWTNITWSVAEVYTKKWRVQKGESIDMGLKPCP